MATTTSLTGEDEDTKASTCTSARKSIFLAGILAFLAWSGILFSCRDAHTTDQEEQMAALGHYLFFDTRLSFNNTKSCASCHEPSLAFSDGYRRSITATGDMTLHNAPSLINVSAYSFYDWADPGVVTLEQQHLRPLFGQNPVELGIKGYENEVLKRLNEDKKYKELFKAAFPDTPTPITLDNGIHALAAYVRSLQSYSSPYDHYIAGDSNALSNSEKQGMALFFSNRTQCASCHPPPFFTMAGLSKKVDSVYRNTGLYNVGNEGRYPASDPGLAVHTRTPEDDGKFRIPTLRNVALTPPYMHDGSVATLSEVLAIYERGGREISDGPYAGDGKTHPAKDHRISGFKLSNDDKSALIDFLYALSDTTIQSNSLFRNPFKIAQKP